MKSLPQIIAPEVKMDGFVPITDSLNIACVTDKRHDNVLRYINNIIEDLKEVDNEGFLNFEEISYSDFYGREQRMFKLNQDAAILLINRMTGKKALEFQLAYGKAFKKLIEENKRLQDEINKIKQRQLDPETQAARLSGKVQRREYTDVIQRFVPYATAQGSKNANRYYITLTLIPYRCLELIEKNTVPDGFRDMLEAHSLTTLEMAEYIATNAIDEGMDRGMFYKDIFQFAKDRVNAFSATIPNKTRRLQVV